MGLKSTAFIVQAIASSWLAVQEDSCRGFIEVQILQSDINKMQILGFLNAKYIC